MFIEIINTSFYIFYKYFLFYNLTIILSKSKHKTIKNQFWIMVNNKKSISTIIKIIIDL